MSDTQNQTESEEFILKRFLVLMGIRDVNIRRGPLVNGNHKPDFIVQIDGRQIGIEETTYYRQPRPGESLPRQAKENAWDNRLKDVIEGTRKKYTELNEIHGVIRYRNFTLPPSKEYDLFANGLVKFAISKLEELGSDYVLYKTFDDEYGCLRKYVEYFELKKFSCYVPWDWKHNANHVGFQKDTLSNIIQAKMGKYIDCQVDENWLLITSGTQISQQIGHLCISSMNEWEDVLDLLKKSPFDKVYVYDYMDRRIIFWAKEGKWEEIDPNNP
jgi:hypothetical protein